MSEQVAENSIKRLESQRTFLESRTWRPEDTQDAMAFYDFQDDVAELLTMWKAACRLNDYLLEHDMEFSKVHQEFFDVVNQVFKVFFLRGSQAVSDVLPLFERKFGNVEGSTDLRTAVQLAGALLKSWDSDSLSKTRTPIEDWV